MQWIVVHRPELRLIVIYIRYWSAVDSLQWNVESTLELDYEGASTPMGPNGPYFELIYHNSTIYEGQIGSRFILMHKSVFVITNSCIGHNKQGLQIRLIINKAVFINGPRCAPIWVVAPKWVRVCQDVPRWARVCLNGLDVSKWGRACLDELGCV